MSEVTATVKLSEQPTIYIDELAAIEKLRIRLERQVVDFVQNLEEGIPLGQVGVSITIHGAPPDGGLVTICRALHWEEHQPNEESTTIQTWFNSLGPGDGSTSVFVRK